MSSTKPYLRDLFSAGECPVCRRYGYGDMLCDECFAALESCRLVPPRFDIPFEDGHTLSCAAALQYRDEAKTLLLYLKQYDSTDAFHAAAMLMLPALYRLHVPAGAMFVHVPRDMRKIRKNGFDQADMLASYVVRLYENGAYRASLLARSLFSKEQKLLTAEERLKNVSGLFRVRLPWFVVRHQPPAVVLVDDLVTSGATARECARVLYDCMPDVPVYALFLASDGNR